MTQVLVDVNIDLELEVVVFELPLVLVVIKGLPRFFHDASFKLVLVINILLIRLNLVIIWHQVHLFTRSILFADRVAEEGHTDDLAR